MFLLKLAKKNILSTPVKYSLLLTYFLTGVSSKLMFTADADAWKMVFTIETTVLNETQKQKQKCKKRNICTSVLG